MMFVIIMLVAAGAGAGVLATPGEIEERDECSEPLQCGPNSHFERCSKICPPQNCSALIDPYWLCENPRCKPECRCDDGYVRDDRTGVCISRDECLAQCGFLERFVKDSPECQRTCANYKVTGPRSLCKPYTGCVCEEGRVRLNDNATGACVLSKDCPHRQCPLHEHFEDCPSVCAKESCISKNPDYICLLPAIPLPCKPRCICDKGYLRNHLGHCIPEKHCPIKSCPINEVWRCAAMCPWDSCKRLEPGFKCPPGIISVCIPACACKDGYLRNDRGLCIPRELCPASLRCGINEVAVECQAYLPQTCESVYTLYKRIENPPCIPGCDCRPGYLRNKRNICVPSEFCPTVPQNQCGPNQEYKECGSSCEPSCADLDDPPQVCSDVCVAGCFCKDGYLKDDQGNCVTRSQCPLPVCNKPNEVPTDCGSYCEMRTCEDYNRTDIVCPAVCVRGCFCRKDYVRNAYGICIRKEKCPPNPVCLQEHEVYQSCGSSCPDNCDNYLNPDRICTANCVAGCNCEAGYVRNLKDNTCIQPEQCPSKECTGENEELNLCASYCPVTCANRYTQGDWSCITLCREACDCIPGTLRNDSGSCVPVEQCTPPVCRENEKYMKCGTACPLSCDNYKKPPPCTRQCVEDCFCKDGYVRDRFMRCVKPEDCEPICPAGEKFNECSAHCQDTCENYNVTNRICTYQCQSGCVCDEGTVRRKDGQCVPPSECIPQNQCGPNQEYKECGSSCEPSCADLDDPPQVCSDVCVAGCFCKDGYLKDDQGNCVTRSQCPLPVCNKPNEVPTDCGSYCEMRTCEDYNRTDIVCPAVCVRGCFCRKDYVRNAYGICIRKEKCPPNPVCLQEHEVYQSCGSSCPDNCDNYLNPDRICTANCVAGCNCEAGYVRNLKDNTCIQPEQCPSKECTGENEELNLCASYCPVTCANRYTQGDWSCITLCREACDCIPGTLRNDSGSCVPVEQCTPPVCRENEKYMKCGTACPLSCDNYKKPPPCTRQCVEDCFCKDGYVRDRFMRCVKPEDCEPICPAGEKFNECSAHCQDTCENYNVTNRICTYQCQSGCVCDEGTVRRKDGQCVPPSECTDNIVCRTDEIYDPCSAHCEPTCDHHGPDRVCTAICAPGCRCGDGLVRRKDGKCVKLEECPPTCPESEHYDDCNAHCEDTCELQGSNVTCLPYCNAGCRCNDGLVRRKDGQCVPLQDCSAPLCSANEVYDPCPPIDCPPGYSCAQVCTPGCKCADGLIRCKDGRCAKQEDCETTAPVCSANEVYDPCPPINCPPGYSCAQVCTPRCECADGLVRCKDGRCAKQEDCETTAPLCSANEVYDPCPPIDCPPGYSCAQVCTPGCKCADGLIRCKDGRCAKQEDCETTAPVCSANEVYDPCPPINCPPGYSCAQVCTPRCECADGLVRCKDGRCAKQEDCETNNECGVNERWVDCPFALCIALTCDQLGYPIACPSISGPCDGGCVCAENYVRDNNNVCIPKQNCPSCGNDFNATSGCGIHCGSQCTDYKDHPHCNIPMPCQYNGCDCREGYVYDIVTERCVAPIDCPIPCNGDLYAEKVKCPNPCPATCSKPTTAVCPRACLTKGCQCRPGFVLNPDGKCVKPENCPDDLGCNGDPNSRISSCVSLCQPICGRAPIFCPAICRLGCACKYGFILSKPDGICIKPEQCVNDTSTTESPSYETPLNRSSRSTSPDDTHPTVGPPKSSTLILCPNNEIWIDCKPGYSKPQYCRDINTELASPQVADPCPGGCICKEGLLRNEDDVCIPKDQCPISRPCSDPNAIRKKCASHESCRATCAVPNSRVCPKICIIDGCECRKGYVLSEKGGKCVRIEDCPQGNVTCNGDPNAVIRAFPPPCPSTCKLPNGIPGCLKLGLDVGCQCKPGYLLSNENGKCILPDNCKGGNPCGANATFSWCRVNCPQNYCPVDDSRAIIACDPPYSCPSGCVCKLNYRIKSQEDDRCILSSTCPRVECTRLNEVWDSCPSDCRRESCTDVNNQPTTCNTLVLNCQPQCVCKKGYFRNATDICIPAKDCPNNKPCDDPNAERLECAPAPSCRSTCAKPNPSPCILSCAVNECVCKKGYVLSAKGGKCIPVNQCPKDAPCNGDSNAVIKANPIPCPSTCNSPNANPWCKRYAPPVGCECKPGYLQIEDGGKCITPEECPGGNPCGANSTFVWCKVSCPNDYCPVDDRRAFVACDPPYPCPNGCVCNLNHRRKSVSDDRCILASSCPRVKCTRPNEIWEPCPSACLSENCADVNNQPTTCNTLVLNCQSQCVCKKGYFRNGTDICIPAKDCPNNQPCDDPNAERLECAPAPSCRSTCAVPDPSPCIQSCSINECVCKKGYVLSAKGGKCLPVDECPKDAPCNGDSNTVIKVNPIPCPSTCSSPNASPWCKRYAPPVGCECKLGYLLAEEGGKCIKPEECPGGNPCGKNATFVGCTFNCPTNKCPVTDTRGIVACSPPYPCPSGCACRLNYKRKSNSDYSCILASDCPPVNCTRPNEKWSPCPSACLRENCADVDDQPTVCNTLVFNCQPRCICKKGYFRNDTDICIPAKNCPKNKPCSDPNAERVKCAPAVQCRPTCDVRDPGPCIEICVIDDCVCKKGFILSEKGGECIPEDQCPNSNTCSDPNAERVECALPTNCRPTCAVPNRLCISQICIKNQCVCKDGYVLSEIGGKCVTPSQCPKDAPCNEDSNAVIKANPIPCPSTCNTPNASPYCKRYTPPVGCECKPGYLFAEYGGKCIKPNECPDGNPCGKNATFVACNYNCPSNYCPKDDTQAIAECRPPPGVCPSGCACNKDYKRKNESGHTCILASDCPNTSNQCSDPNAERVECALDNVCRATCAVPNPGPCLSDICIKNECVCKKGFVLSAQGGKCVAPDQCPIQKSCNRDPNAQIKECPLPCPATCDAPNAVPCRKACVPIGCQCKDGYILSESNGKCILPEKCKGGYPCSRNETFVPCRVPCPSDYCPTSNSPNRVICETPNPCYPGCVCKFNYRRKSVDDRRCIYASECPPQKCNKNEEWSSCPSECLQEDCSNVNDRPVICNTLLLNCQPKCICKKGYYRDSDRNCVPASQCPKPIKCKPNEVYRTCRIICPPQTCASIYSDYDCRNATRCEPGCDCISEYLRNGTENDPCIPSSQCPTTPPVTPECGINEHYETNRNKCELTCKNYELEPVMGPCQETSGCFCDTGYVRNSNGLCIPKKKCPKNIVCPPNEVVSECYNSCHTTCKTRLRSDGRMCQLACIDTGCLCKEGYLRHDNGTCVPISECSPPHCDENETYSSCGTACPPTCQNRGDNCTACTDQCVEDCFCNKGFVRSDDRTCIRPKDCPKRTCNDCNEVFDECPPTCPPTDGCSNLWSKFNCTNAIKCCKPQCRCRPQYFRNNKGICVPSSQC